MSVKDMIKKSVLKSGVFDQYNISSILVVLVAALALGILIFLVYRRFYTGVIYSRTFAVTLVGMTVLTCMVTLAISTNVVISLGMVGALSIVRFRTAIKDPMDLVFLFWSISIGIICGAGLAGIALVASAITTIMLIVLEMLPIAKSSMLLVLNAKDTALENKVEEVLKSTKTSYKVKSRTFEPDRLDMIIEVRTSEEAKLVSEISKIEGITRCSLVAHDGEVTL